MAKKLPGTDAIYDITGNETTWVYSDDTMVDFGKNTQILESGSFGDCVGLVLFQGGLDKKGVVAHFPGNRGLTPMKTAKDAKEILQVAAEGNWKAWVFGGVRLSKGSAHESSAIGTTKKLIDYVRKALDKDGNITEDDSTKGQYVGHGSVSLEIATGKVTFDGSSAKSDFGKSKDF